MKNAANSLKLPISLDDVLRGKSVEWERLEYKAGWNPEAVLHTVCAFANDFHNLGGGYIVIGVEDDNGRPVLPPVGISPDEIDAIQKELLNLGHSAIQPMYHPLSAPCEVDGKWILVVWAPGGETRPYKARLSLSEKKTDWAYYIRKQSNTVRAKGADEQELIGLAATVPFDDRYNQQASVDALSPRLVEGFLREVGSDLADDVQALPPEALGRQMNIVGGPSEAVFPKILHAMAANGSPPPVFDFDEDHTYFMCRLLVHPSADTLAGEQRGPRSVPSLSQVCTKSVQPDTVGRVLQTADPVADLQTLMTTAGHTNRTRFRNAVLRPLIASGLIEMTIPDKPRSSKQKYRLTDKGRDALNDTEGD